jgi:hypothetical protein
MATKANKASEGGPSR